jgi:hypothetical protein
MSIPFITHTRATVATRVNKAGLLETVGANFPVSNFKNGVLLGYYSQRAATNLLRRSEEFDNGYWTKDNLNITGTPPYVNVAIAPDGTLTAEKIIADATNTAHNFNVLQNITINLPYFFSAFLKRDEYQYGYIRGLTAGGNFGTAIFDLENGTVLSAGSADEAGIIDLANGWYRCYVKFTATATTTVRLRFGVSDNDTSMIFEGDGTSGIFIWGAQLEVGSEATSYIKTVDTTVTRNKDIATLLDPVGIVQNNTGAIGSTFDAESGYPLIVNGLQHQCTGVTTWLFEYSPSLITLTVNGVVVDSREGTFNFSTLDQGVLEYGHFKENGQPNFEQKDLIIG